MTNKRKKTKKCHAKKSHLKHHFLSFCLAFFVISSIHLAFFRNFVFLRGVLSLFHRLAWHFFVFSLGIFFVISSIRLAFFFFISSVCLESFRYFVLIAWRFCVISSFRVVSYNYIVLVWRYFVFFLAFVRYFAYSLGIFLFVISSFCLASFCYLYFGQS